MIENINWYPGHMKKTRELIQENLKAVDVVVELLDSRIPVSSRNPIIDELVGQKQRIVVMNKSDLADSDATSEWVNRFRSEGLMALPMDSRSGDNLKKFFAMLEKIQDEKNAARQMNRPLRLMIVGVPNVGKSSFINRLVGKKSTQTGDRPGVTKGKQWVSLENGMQLLDTPGILWPKFEDPKVGLNLAFCGSIKDEIMNIQDLAFELIKVLARDYPDNLTERYKLDELDLADDVSPTDVNGSDGPVTADKAEVSAEEVIAIMDEIARKRGFLLPGKRIDYERMGRTLLDEFRSGMMGRITLEKVDKL